MGSGKILPIKVHEEFKPSGICDNNQTIGNRRQHKIYSISSFYIASASVIICSIFINLCVFNLIISPPWFMG